MVAVGDGPRVSDCIVATVMQYVAVALIPQSLFAATLYSIDEAWFRCVRHREHYS